MRAFSEFNDVPSDQADGETADTPANDAPKTEIDKI
jgi:hypothetical protein